MKGKTRKSILTAGSAFLLMACASAIENTSVTSPDGHLQCTLIHEKNQLSISVTLKGMETSKLLDRATHETTLPFTRMLAGPADYSVCHFGIRRQNTTWVHQAATAAIFCAPVITYASTPAHILENPCAEMIKSIPSVWDETIVLPPSEIGELAVYAQRKGTTWFLSVINGLKPKTIEIPFSFLGKGGYTSLILRDNPADPASANVSQGNSAAGDKIIIELGAGGGYMARFTRE